MKRSALLARAAALVGAVLLVPKSAHAGGVEMPDLGASALGRGAAFTARADDGMAVLYNVAGFAQQRGTRAMISLNVIARSYDFARAGNYPDDPQNPLTPWGGKPFPVVRGEGKPAIIPTLVVSTDFGIDRLALFAALLTPSPAGGGSFPLGVDNGVPNPARYMAVSQNGVIAYPTLGVAYRATDWLDVGAAGHLVVGSVKAVNVATFDTSPKTCLNHEFQPCDLIQQIDVAGTTAAASLGALARLPAGFTAGVNVRTAYTIDMTGTVTPTPPRTLPAAVETVPMSLSLSVPWVLRGGLRYSHMEGNAELFDIEVNGTYETWSQADKTKAFVPKASFLENVDATIDNGYTNCGSVRLGGSFKPRPDTSLRLGTFYETSSVPEWMTRAGGAGGFEKIGLTGGAGIALGPLVVNVAYAAVLSPSREVTDGRVRPGNGARGGDPRDSSDGAGKLYGAVNNGTHSTMAHVFGFSLDMTFGGNASTR